MTQPVLVRLKPEMGGRLTAHAKRLQGFTQKVGPVEEVLTELKAALVRAKLGQTAGKTQVRIVLSWGKGDAPVGADFYSGIGEIVMSGHVYQVIYTNSSGARADNLAFERAEPQRTEPPFRARLAADWPRNAAAAPLVLAAGGIGGGLAAAAGLASFWVAAPVVAFAALLTLSLVFTAVPRV
jgi:hypothetical protein